MWLKNDRMHLRLLANLDDELRRLQSELSEWQNLSEKTLYPSAMPDQMIFKIRMADTTVGMVQLSNIRWYNRKAEIRVWVVPNAQGKGIASSALKMLFEFAFKTLNFHRLEAEVYSFNSKALHLMEKLGFKQEGILREAKYFNGQYHNIIRFGILKKEFLNLLSNEK